MSNEVEQIVQQTEALLRLRNEETLQETTPQRLHECLGEVVMVHINDNWVKTKKRQTAGRRAFYFSAEYLVGRLVYSNLFNLGILSEVKKAFAEKGVDLACLEEIGYLNGWIGKDQLLTDIEPLKKNQYGQYLMDVMNGKYIDK